MSETARSIRAQTRVHHVCSWCAAVLETSHTPWTGEAVITTHGVCRWCFVEARLRDQLVRSGLGSGPTRVSGTWSERSLAAQSS